MKTKASERLRRLPALFFLFAATSLAQDADIQKQLIQRQQQSDAFTLQLRQSQERLKVSPGDIRSNQQFDARHFSERQRLDNVSAKQLIEVKPDAPQALRPIERQRADDERRPLTLPAGGIIKPD
jgi:hypothetical protein